MIRHIVMWDMISEMSSDEKLANAKKIKAELENLSELIDTIKSIEVKINLLPTSNCDILLNSSFDDIECLNKYQIHPEHKRVGAFINSVTENKRCADYIC